MNSFCAACQGEPGANEDFEASSIYGVGCACCDEVVSGCMDETMSNYNPEATWDDGSCYLEGCTDENAENYNELATDDDGSCEYFDGYHGCMDESAFNYNPDAQINAVSADDDSDPCLYLGCIDNGEMVYNEDNFNIITNPGVMDTNWSPFPGIPADNYVGDELAAVGNIVMSESNLINSYVFYGFWDVCTYSGCMDENALNYIINDIQYAGSVGFPDLSVFIQNNITENNDLCEYPPIDGCMDESATNYNPVANNDDGSCIYEALCYSCEYGMVFGEPGNVIEQSIEIIINPETNPNEPYCEPLGEDWFEEEPESCPGEPIDPFSDDPEIYEGKWSCIIETGECLQDNEGPYATEEECYEEGYCGENRIECYKCKDGSPVGMDFWIPIDEELECPKGW